MALNIGSCRLEPEMMHVWLWKATPHTGAYYFAGPNEVFVRVLLELSHESTDESSTRSVGWFDGSLSTELVKRIDDAQYQLELELPVKFRIEEIDVRKSDTHQPSTGWGVGVVIGVEIEPGKWIEPQPMPV
jgi:hypothetical protein